MMEEFWQKNPLYTWVKKLVNIAVGFEQKNQIMNRIGWSSSLDVLIWCFRKLRIPIYYVNRYFEPEVFQHVRNLKGKIAIDIGAHIGSYTTLFSENFEIVVAIEPYLPCRRILRSLGKKNVAIVPFAISNKEGFIPFYAYPHSGHNSILKQRDVGGIVQYVYALSLEDLLGNGAFNGWSVDLVKVDVEGAEWKVLQGAENVMHKIKAWVVEIHEAYIDQESGREKAFSYFQNHGYNCKWLKPTHVLAWRR